MRQVIENRAVLDCIGFDIEGRGEMECRFQLASFRSDGGYVDDGSRTGPIQKQKYRFVLKPGDDIDALIAAMTPHLATLGYDPPDAADILKLKAVALACWTPEAVAEQSHRWLEWERANEVHCRQLGIKPMAMEQGRSADFAAVIRS